MTTITFHIERGDVELELRIDGDVEPPEPGRIVGPPERCVEPHGGFVEFTEIVVRQPCYHVGGPGKRPRFTDWREWRGELTESEQLDIEAELLEQHRQDSEDAAINAAEARWEARMDR